MGRRYQFYASDRRNQDHPRIFRKNLPETSLYLYGSFTEKESPERRMKK
jgi:hypothetical protein